MRGNCVLLYPRLQQRHSVDQCSGEQSRVRPDRATPPRVQTSPRGLSLSKLNLKGASETTVKILLQRKHQRGEKERKDHSLVLDLMDTFLRNLWLFLYVARCSDVFHFSQCVYTTARHTLMETCGIQFWGRCWSASCALAPMASRTANASHVPVSTRASILWNQQENAARLAQVVKRDLQHDELFILMWCWLASNIIQPVSLSSPPPPENKAESNKTQCYLGYKNNLLVYKVESSLAVDSPHTVRIIAVERQSTAEIEVQVWNTVEGTGTHLQHRITWTKKKKKNNLGNICSSYMRSSWSVLIWSLI